MCVVIRRKSDKVDSRDDRYERVFPDNWRLDCCLAHLCRSLGICGFYKGPALDESSKSYVEMNIPPILSKWSKGELLKRSSAQLTEIVDKNPAELDRLFQKFSKLGAMKTFSHVKGEANIALSMRGKVVTAAYTADASFDNGNAKIDVRLVQAPDGEWKLSFLNITSPVLSQ